MVDLTSFRRRGSAIVGELESQESSMADLQKQLEAARLQGEKLKEEAAAAPVVDAGADDAGFDYEALMAMADASLAPRAPGGGAGAPAPAPTAAPSTADLLKLADGTSKPEAARKFCKVCGEDPYALQSQLVPCTNCAAPFHVGCVGLRAIPFKGATRSDRNHRELFVKRYFGDWKCASCRKEGPPAVAVAAPPPRSPPPADAPTDTPSPAPSTERGPEPESEAKPAVPAAPAAPAAAAAVPEGHCVRCGSDAPRERPQLLSCATCSRRYHTSCLKLRRIPFSTSAREKAFREKFIRQHYCDWKCPDCDPNRPPPPPPEPAAVEAPPPPAAVEAAPPPAADTRAECDALRKQLAESQAQLAKARAMLADVTRERDELRAATVGMASLSAFAEDLSTDPDV